MKSTILLFFAVLLNIVGKLDAAAIAPAADNNNGTVTDGRMVKTQTVRAEPPAASPNAGLMEQEWNQEMAERHGAGLQRQIGANRRRQHTEFEWRNPQAVGQKGLNGQQFFGENENENEGFGNRNGMNGQVNREFGEFEGPRAIQPVATGNANNGNWNQNDFVWGDYGLAEPNRWKRQVYFEGEGRNDGLGGTRMFNAEAMDQWNENGWGDYGNERKKRASKMKDVNQWVMRGISHVNFADIDWAGQIARAIAKWNRMQVFANKRSEVTANNTGTMTSVAEGTATTDNVPFGDTGTATPITGVPADLPPSTAAGSVMGVTDGFIDIPVSTWSPRQIEAVGDTWGDYRPGEQPVKEPNGIDYMVDYGQDPEFPPKAVGEEMQTQGGQQQMTPDNGLGGDQATANEWSANAGNADLNYDYNNTDYGQGGNNRNKRAPPRVHSVNEWIIRDIRKVNFADDDWLGQIAMAIAVWNQRHAADKPKAFTVGVNADMNTPGDIPLAVPVPVDLNTNTFAVATTLANVPSSMNVNAPVFEAPTTPVNVPATINAFVEDPTLGAVNVPSSVNGNLPKLILPTVFDTPWTNSIAPGDFTTAPTRNMVAESPNHTTGAVWTDNEAQIDNLQVINGKVVGNGDTVTENVQEPARWINTLGTVADLNPEQTTSVPGQDYLVTDGVPVDLNQINYDAPLNPEPWIADANKGDYGWGDYAWTENRAVKVDQWGKKEYNTQDNVDYNYGDYNGQKQLNGGDYNGNGQTNTPTDYTGLDYTAVDYGNTDNGQETQPSTVDNAGQWQSDLKWADYGWDGNTNNRKRREVENEGWWDKRQLKEWNNGFDYQLKSVKTKRATTINDLNKWIMSDIGKVNFGDDDWLGQIAMAIVTWREKAMAASIGQTVTNGDTPNAIDNADIGAQTNEPVATGTPNPDWSGTTPTVTAIPDLQFGTDAPRALNAANVSPLNNDNNIVQADTQNLHPRGLTGPWNADYVAGDYSWGKPPLVSPQNIYNGDYNWLDYALGNLLDTGNQGDYNWGAVDYIGQQPAVPENQGIPEGNGADVGFETNPKLMDGTNLFNIDYGNTDYGVDGQVVEANGQIKGDKPVAETGNVPQLQVEVNPDYQTTTDGAVPKINAGDGQIAGEQINGGERPITVETNWQDNGLQVAKQNGNAKWLGDFNWGDYGWGGNTNDRKKREVENEGWWDVRKLTKPLNTEFSWNDYGLSIARAKRAATNMKIAKAVNEWVLRDINNVNFADDDWPGMIAQSIATWKRHFIKTGHKAIGFDQMPHGKEPTANTGAANDGTTAIANDGIKSQTDPANPAISETTNGPINATVDAVTNNGVMDTVTSDPQKNNIDGGSMISVWNDYAAPNTDYLDYVPETTTFTWITDPTVSNVIDGNPQAEEWKQVNYPDWTEQTTQMTNDKTGVWVDNWNKQLNQAGETGQTPQAVPEPEPTNAFLGLEAMNPIRQLKSGSMVASTGESPVVENPSQNNITTENNGGLGPRNITTNQQDGGVLFGKLNAIDNPEGVMMNTPAETQFSNNQNGDTAVEADQRVQSEGTGTAANTDQQLTDAQIEKLKRIAAGNDVRVDGGPGDLNEINWFDYAGFGEYEGGVRQLNGGVREDPTAQELGAETGNRELNDYNWIDYGRTQPFTDYDGPGVQEGVEPNAATGVQNEPDYNVFAFSTAGFVDGQTDLQKLNGGKEQGGPSGVTWADYGGNRMKREVDQAQPSERTKKKPVLSRKQRITILHGLQHLFKSALLKHRKDTKTVHHPKASTNHITNRQNLNRRKWLTRRLAAYDVLDDLPRHIIPSEIDNWWTRKQIHGGGRENGRNKRDVFGNKDVGHDVNNNGRQVSMPDAHFRQHEFSSSLLLGHKGIKNNLQFTDGLGRDQGDFKDPGWNNGLILSKLHSNFLKRSAGDSKDSVFASTWSLPYSKSTMTDNGVEFRASAPRTVTPKPEVKNRVRKPFVEANPNIHLTDFVDLPKDSPSHYRDATFGNVLDTELKIDDAGRGYIESVQNNADRSIKIL